MVFGGSKKRQSLKKIKQLYALIGIQLQAAVVRVRFVIPSPEGGDDDLYGEDDYIYSNPKEQTVGPFDPKRREQVLPQWEDF